MSENQEAQPSDRKLTALALFLGAVLTASGLMGGHDAIVDTAKNAFSPDILCASGLMAVGGITLLLTGIKGVFSHK